MNTPKPTQPKEIVQSKLSTPGVPAPAQLVSEQLEEVPKLKILPKESDQKEGTPDPSPEKEEKPAEVPEEDCVTISGQKIQIKPTKLKYFRNKAASGYGLIKSVPLHELLTYEKGVLDEKRNADQLLFDFLVAVFDDSAFVRDHYDDLDADVIDRIVKIFGRLNHVDEKEEAARKNREAQAAAKR